MAHVGEPGSPTARRGRQERVWPSGEGLEAVSELRMRAEQLVTQEAGRAGAWWGAA